MTTRTTASGVLAALAASALAACASAPGNGRAGAATGELAGGEGMWTPGQLPALAGDLRRAGLELDPESLADLSAPPMNAIIWLGNCTASFVSPQGLVVTNHHCARGSVQYNSTEEHNYLADGFYAETLADELPAAPGARVYVTLSVTDVTEEINAGLTDEMSGLERYDAVDAAEKALVAECEATPGRRCRVASYHGGYVYELIERLEIRDVRLVQAPGDMIGRYGGDIDNWQWPRHVGDFAFYRAYVGPDGAPADFSPDNVPYTPPHHLPVSRAGVADGDFVMAAGYPGSTSRYRRLAEVEYAFDVSYPRTIEVYTDRIDVIEDATAPGSDARIRYAGTLSSLNNTLKNRIGQIEGALRADLIGRRAEREEALDAWTLQGGRGRYATAIAGLDALAVESNAAQDAGFWYQGATSATLLGAAQNLYRWSIEQQKPDAERESGYQERDRTSLRDSLQSIERRYAPSVDKALWMYGLERYMTEPGAVRVPALDEALGLPREWNADVVSRRLDAFYANTSLDDLETRLGWIDAAPAAFEASRDPFIRLAVALYDYEIDGEREAKERAGLMLAYRPVYMEAIIALNEAEGLPVYPDANSTLRVTYGEVVGGSPADGIIYEPFTRLEGILGKHTGIEPFDSPDDLNDLIRAGDFGAYYVDEVGSVPVDFLSNLDITGGNSGSPAMNARGELVGLLFDGTIESVNSDWQFDARTTRAIQVDSRYMLWLLDAYYGADRLLEEMTIVDGR